jgi:integrase
MFTGLRRRSATTIRRADIDLEGAVIRVTQMKSGRPFLLPLSDFLGETLRRRMADDEPLDSPWLWPSGSRSGHVEEPKEPGLPSPHEYRHLWRTYAIAAGVPFAGSALLLDHRLPDASGGYVHPEHLADHFRSFQQRVTDHLLGLIGECLSPQIR